MNGRRGFLKSFVGAFVASAIDLRMVTEMELAQVAKPTFDPVAYIGEFQWINTALNNAWEERHREAYAAISTTLPKALDTFTPN
jgi:hypothetical protein